VTTSEIAPGIIQIDTLLGGWDKVTAGYLVQGDAPVLVETGSQSSVRVLLDALGTLGVSPSDLAGVAVTHIHLDHAGGVGDVARAFPTATVYVHEKGARHLVDPTRLIDSAARVYGPLLDSLYGRLDATPAPRIHVLADGEEIRVSGDRVLTTVDSPGHAKHHLALHDSTSGILFAGDAVGVRLPDAGVLRPSTPPPDFDLDQSVHSLHRFALRRPTGLALAHYGLLAEPEAVLETVQRMDGHGRTGVARRGGHRRGPRRRLRVGCGRRRRRAPREARHAQRCPLERGGLPALARHPRRPRHPPSERADLVTVRVVGACRSRRSTPSPTILED